MKNKKTNHKKTSNVENKNTEKNDHDIFKFTRCCMNCIKRNDCEKIPKKESLNRWREWCASFIPDYRKIDRLRTNHAISQIVNPDSLNGFRRELLYTGEVLERVEEVLNSTVADIKEGDG